MNWMNAVKITKNSEQGKQTKMPRQTVLSKHNASCFVFILNNQKEKNKVNQFKNKKENAFIIVKSKWYSVVSGNPDELELTIG